MQRSAIMMTVWGLFISALGTFYMVVASGLVQIGEAQHHEDPRWVSVLAGLIFLLGGLALLIRAVVGSDDQAVDGLPADAPRWARGMSQLLALGIALSFAAVFGWIGFGPGERHFEGSGAVLGPSAGRMAFGFGSCLIVIVLAVLAWSRLRRLRGGVEDRP